MASTCMSIDFIEVHGTIPHQKSSRGSAEHVKDSGGPKRDKGVHREQEALFFVRLRDKNSEPYKHRRCIRIRTQM